MLYPKMICHTCRKMLAKKQGRRPELTVDNVTPEAFEELLQVIYPPNTLSKGTHAINAHWYFNC